MSDFYENWFKGWEEALDSMPKAEQSKMLGACGKACSDSYSKERFEKAWNSTKVIHLFFEELKQYFDEFNYVEIERDKKYEIRYSDCYCDLYRNGYVKTGNLCECSRQSMLYNLSSLWPEKEVKVELLDSIIRGGKQCILHVTIQ